MIHLLHDWFGWPDGSVLTNLVASVVGFLVGFFVGRHWIRSLHGKLSHMHDHILDLHHHHGVATTKHE